MIRAGSFRQDLLYRLNVIELCLPALAERPEDILPLAESFLDAGKSLHISAQNALLSYGWPGNVRELKNVLQRACLLAAGHEINTIDLGLPVAMRIAASDVVMDKEAVERALQQAGGVIASAAADLGLSRQALYRRMDRLGIER
jgi:DNA-binding NtrC family response regulator